MSTKPINEPKLKLPKDFLWGASTSAHQVEGYLHNDWTVWELENAKSLSVQAKYQFGDLENWSSIAREAENPENYISGRATDHFSRYKSDFKILKSLNFNAFRFGIEWARVEPNEGEWDKSAFDHYRRYLGQLRADGVTPVVTLFHFTLPVWFSEAGGFTKRRNIKYFIRYVEKVLEELGQEISYLISVNEPTVYVYQSYIVGDWPPNKKSPLVGIWTLLNLIAAHRRVYRLTQPTRRYQLGLAHHVTHFYEDDGTRLSRLGLWAYNYFANYFVIDCTKRTSDFLGVNFYQSIRLQGLKLMDSEAKQNNDLGWSMQPAKLLNVLVALGQRYEMKIMITENGLADGGDEQRKWWLGKTLQAISTALKQRIKLIGYLHWSLLDNFEWDKGYWPRFGLVEVDRKTLTRRVRPSARWFGQFLGRLKYK